MYRLGFPEPLPRGPLAPFRGPLRPWRSGPPAGGGAGSGSASAPATSGAPIGFQPAPLAGLPVGILSESASRVWVRQVAETTNNILQGKLNATLLVTLGHDSASTTVIDSRISAFSALLFTPLTANAAAELAAGALYVSERKQGQATIAHQNSAQTDRDFNMLIIG